MKIPPWAAYSPSVFSRITTMSSVSAVAVRIGVLTPGYRRMGRRLTYWSNPRRMPSINSSDRWSGIFDTSPTDPRKIASNPARVSR